jgi:hypothetical protein
MKKYRETHRGNKGRQRTRKSRELRMKLEKRRSVHVVCQAIHCVPSFIVCLFHSPPKLSRVLWYDKFVSSQSNSITRDMLSPDLMIP